MNILISFVCALGGIAFTYFWLTNRFASKSVAVNSEFSSQLQQLQSELRHAQEKYLDLEKQVACTISELKESNIKYMELHGAHSSLITSKEHSDQQIMHLASKNDALENSILEVKQNLKSKEEDFAQTVNKLLLKEAELQLWQNKTADLKAEIEKCGLTICELQANIQAKNEEILKLSTELSAGSSNIRAMAEKLDQQKSQVEEIQTAFYAKFQQVATEILDSKSQKFTELNQNNIKEILTPLHEKLKEFESKVADTHLEETKQRSILGQEIRNLVELNYKISKEANNLANALKNNVKSMGNWGELILESILENSGLQKDREYKVQPSFSNSDGQLRQPDVVIYFPDKRCVIIDSKVSLLAFERFVSCEDSAQQEIELKNHILSVRQHIDGLSAKNYPALYQLEDFSLDFVMMFMPVEPSYLLAMQKDTMLWNYAYQKKIILISPTNLIAILKMISSLWKQEYQNRNVMEIARLSGAMYDKFCGFLDDLTSVGNSLDTAQKKYDLAMNKISTGKGNLLVTAEKIKKLGSKTSKSLPAKLSLLVEDEELPELELQEN